jgi:hypothetical protein
MDSTQWAASVETVKRTVRRINGVLALARTSDSDRDDRIQLVIGVSSSNCFRPVAESAAQCARCVPFMCQGMRCVEGHATLAEEDPFSFLLLRWFISCNELFLNIGWCLFVTAELDGVSAGATCD